MSARTLFPVEDDVLEKVLKIFDKNEKMLKEDVTLLMTWLESQPHLPKVTNRKLVENFLIQNKFSIEITKQKLDWYFTVKSKLVYIYSDMDPSLPHMKQFRDLAYLVPYPKLTPEMYRVFFLQLRHKNLGHTLEHLHGLRNIINLLELSLRQDVRYGDMIVIDFEGFAPCLINLTPVLCYNAMIEIHKKVFSFRVKAAYIINSSSGIQYIMQMLKSMINEKSFQRIYFCTLSELQKEFDSDMLPKDFGGSGPSLEKLQGDVEFHLRANEDLFYYLNTARVEEKLRPARLENDECNIYGSFKKLEID